MTLEFYGDTQIKRTLADIDARALDLRPVWHYLVKRFIAAERRQFATEGVYGSGRRWAPLTPAYAREKARAGFGSKPILRRTDDLYNSLTREPLGLEVIEPAFMVIGSDVYYGKFHQKGEGNNKVRKPIEFPESERRLWVKTIQRFIMTGELP